jgi:holo-ACP synthase/triphosphoribosyl-dephospho-CoA synthase
LNAREQRAEFRRTLCGNSIGTLSFCLNIPGYPKSNSSTKAVFGLLINDLDIFLNSKLLGLDFSKAGNSIDEAGHFFIISLKDININIYELKDISEHFENEHPLGRLLDVDVYGRNGVPISSGKRKRCIICEDHAAVECMRENRHKLKDLRKLMFSMIDEYVEKYRISVFERRLVEASNKSLHYEFLLSPKPGLVDFYGSGSHNDMNHYTFLNSAAALTIYWKDFAESGSKYKGNPLNALTEIRRIGISAEKAMFKASRKVNTQKGAIFVFGISIFAAAFIFKNNHKFSIYEVREYIKHICSNIIENELGKTGNRTKTHGEETYKRYGILGAGVRWEVQNGFPLIFNSIIPLLEENHSKLLSTNRKDVDKILITALLVIMSQLNDSNILFRNGKDKLKHIKELSAKSLNDIKYYSDLCRYCLKENISPGGSADMLALALFFFFIKHQDQYNEF